MTKVNVKILFHEKPKTFENANHDKILLVWQEKHDSQSRKKKIAGHEKKLIIALEHFLSKWRFINNLIQK